MLKVRGMLKFRSFFGFLFATLIGVFFSELDAFCQETSPIPQKQEALSISEYAILDSFFHVLFEESQGGYVFYGNKPICAEGILPKEENLFMVGGLLHRHSVVLKEGLRVWKNLNLENKNYYIHCYEIPSYGWQQILVINREEFIKTVQKNLQLFQYVLGPKLTPNRFFEQLIDPKESFSSLFKDDKVLIGILLGFGTQNALHVGREENVSEELFRNKHPSSQQGFRSVGETPSFGFSSLDEELKQLNEGLYNSNQLVPTSFPAIPWFGCLKTAETKQLLKSYTKSRKTIQKTLRAPNFLEEVLTRISGKKDIRDIVLSLSTKYQAFQSSCWPSIIAQSILQGIPEKEDDWLNAFIQGMSENDKGISLLSSQEWDHLRDALQETTLSLKEGENTEELAKELHEKQQTLRLQEAHQLGARTWAHFKLGQEAGYSMDVIIEALYFKKEKECVDLSQEETDLLTHLHWIIYKKKSLA